MASTRELRHHIRSVRSTRQITKAMEMVAASKLRRATDSATASRPYALRIAEALRDALITPDNQSIHPLLVPRPVKKTVLVVISSDRGLAGAYNTGIIKAALEFITTEKAAGRTVDCITFGRKAEQALARLGIPIVQSYEHSGSHPVAQDVLPLAGSLADYYTDGTYDQVMVLNTHFVSAFKQEPRVTHFLPLTHEEFEITTAGDAHFVAREKGAEQRHEHMFLYEPGPEALLSALIPRYLETLLFQHLQEALASEHAARRMAMHSATDNASDIIESLQLTYNSVRQSSITQELAEITSGAVSLQTD
ncbi:MAG TPA: ATP synthase F1 subunit gamma [Verrucomicrobiae bacterium]|nr:ATP synthase F1 subunit gamma [Verrucomicrobiae bacterium]